jgi:hypothetical protein
MKTGTTTLFGVIDRIEDNKIVVINLNNRKGSMYIAKSVFSFKVYEGMHLKIDITHQPDKEQEIKLQIQQLQNNLLSRSKKK